MVKKLQIWSKELQKSLNKEKLVVEPVLTNEELKAKVEEKAIPGLKEAMKKLGKHERQEDIDNIKKLLLMEMNAEDNDELKGQIKSLFNSLKKHWYC